MEKELERLKRENEKLKKELKIVFKGWSEELEKTRNKEMEILSILSSPIALNLLNVNQIVELTRQLNDIHFSKKRRED